MAEAKNIYGNPPPGDFDSVVNRLCNIFGEDFDKTSIAAIVENCGGDLSQSAELIMEIVNSDNNINVIPPTQPVTPQQVVPDDQSLSSHHFEMSFENPSFSYASISKSQGAIAKTKSNDSTPKKATDVNSMKDIMEHHTNGTKILILLRGVPGSGKSYLAKEIVAKTVGPGDFYYENHIFSTDDYFIRNGQYRYDINKLSMAHEWNHARVRNAAMRGLSPIVIDNTNIKIWEMEPYLQYGVDEGYIIITRRPKTPWAKNAKILSQKNSHHVPTAKIQKMLDTFEDATATGADLIKMFNLRYPTNKVPPVMRNFPTFEVKKDFVTQIPNSHVEKKLENLQINCNTNQEAQNPSNNETKSNLSSPKTQNYDLQSPKKESSDKEENIDKLRKYEEIEEQLTHFDKIVSDWEKGENWEETPEGIKSNNENSSINPKPQRIIKESTSHDQCESNNWENLPKFLCPWEYKSPSSIPVSNTEILIPVESQTCTTCVEAGDTDLINNKYKVVVGTPRDINFYYIPLPEKIPRKRMLDKSSMTNEQMLTEASRCTNEEKHFIAFRKMFKNIATDDLREIFDKCCGDVNWAVEIVLDGVATDKLVTVDEDDSIEPEEPGQDCNCPAAYDVVPDATPESVKEEQSQEEQAPELLMPKKTKKDKDVSKQSIQIKRQIEKNVVISDNHYSEHCLKIRKFRRGENLEDKTEVFETAAEDIQPSTSKATNDEVQSTQEDDAVEETITVNLGPHFLLELDNLFGRKDINYGENILPLVSMPISTLNKINALWMESLTHQMSMQADYSEIILKEDAEFARQLAAKEEELAQEGKEPVVPGLKEIMDMEVALSLYKKDISKWKNNEPNDIAARMSREKLYNLFPNLDHETLSEILMAHDNNFVTTVEVLLTSTGQAHVLEEKDGVSKFISQGEMARHGRMLENIKEEALQEEEWPVLTKIGDDLDMSDVDKYRHEAQNHFEKRNINLKKAQDCVRRGMTQVASYYSAVAGCHATKFNHYNNWAATVLIQINCRNRDNTTVDLHHLYVREALTALDLFIDHHIQVLRESKKDGPKTLYFITGRGLHSENKPKVKPAVRIRLGARGLL